jgi:hypothetical protein
MTSKREPVAMHTGLFVVWKKHYYLNSRDIDVNDDSMLAFTLVTHCLCTLHLSRIDKTTSAGERTSGDIGRYI